MAIQFIQNDEGLKQLCGSLAGKPWIAFDTEFVRESTYYARLGLLQIATDETIACVDPLAVELAPLLDIVYDRSTLKVLHAGRQDLEVLYDLRRDVPRPIFDTQIAAALLGHPAQCGYGALVEAIAGIKLPKLHTRTNWEARPLSAEQLRYAADDVKYLRDVYRRLDNELTRLGRNQWLREECDALTDLALYRNDPELAYARITAGHNLPAASQPLLQALAAWRERTAQQRDRPRSWIATDAALLDIARVAPATLEALQAIAGSLAQSYGADMLGVIDRTRGATPQSFWAEPKPPTSAEKELARRLLDRIQSLGRAQNINPEIISTKRAVMTLIRDRAGPLTMGWRYELVGKELLALLG